MTEEIASQFLLDTLASKHLGKTSDGATMQRYVTPDAIDASLLVALPRELNRTSYGIKPTDFIGNDRWNCYEFSTLMSNGFPMSGKLIITYGAQQNNIVESKSLKLYLNSFNMHRFDTTNPASLMSLVENRVFNDFVKMGIVPTYIEFVPDAIASKPKSREDFAVKNAEEYACLDVEVLKMADFANREFKFPGESPDLLNTIFEYNHEKFREEAPLYRLHSPSLRSNCRVTNQPDWGDIYIAYRSNKRAVTMQSLYDYIISLRTESHFHEEICEVVYKRLKDALDPLDLMVACLYTRRGGIDINPVRASSTAFLNETINSPLYVNILKEPRQ